MAIVVESTANASANATTVTCTKPASTASGDLLVAHWSLRGAFTDGNMTLPTDWNLVKYQQGAASTPSSKMAYKVAGGSEPADYTFTNTTSVNQSVGILRLSGVDTTTPSDVAASGNGAASGTTLTATTITTATANALLVAGFADGQAGSVITDPSDMDEKVAITANCRNTISTAIQASAGASGNKTATQSADTRWSAILWAVRPASGGGTNTPKSVDGTLTSSGTVAKSTAKTFAGTLTSAGATVKATAKAFEGTLTSAGTLTRAIAKVLAGTLTFAGTLTSQLTGGAQEFFQDVGGTLTTAGALAKATAKSLTGTLTSAGALVSSLTFLVAVGGTLTTAGTLVRNTGKTLAGTLTTGGILNRAIAKAVTGTLSFVGSLIAGIVGGEEYLLDVEISDSAVTTATISDSAVYTATITDSLVYTVAISDTTRS